MRSRRFEAFSDGVFAVAITFLVFNLKVPDGRTADLWRFIRDQWPSFAAYIVTFFVIGIIWINHHTLFDRIALVNRPLLFLNLFLLMTVAVLPYPTALLSRFVRDGASSHTAAAIYSTNMTLMAIAFGLIWSYAVFHPELLHDRLDPVLARSTIPRFSGGVIIYVITIGVAFINATLCLAIQALIAIYYMFDQLAGSEPAVAGPDEDTG